MTYFRSEILHIRETVASITSGHITQQRFLSVSSCPNSRGIGVMTAYNLPHVSLNERHNKGYPIHAKCHNSDQRSYITSVSLPRFLRLTGHRSCCHGPEPEPTEPSEERSSLSDFRLANNITFLSDCELFSYISFHTFFTIILMSPPLLHVIETERARKPLLLCLFFFTTRTVYLLHLFFILYAMPKRNFPFCRAGVQQQLCCAPGAARGSVSIIQGGFHRYDHIEEQIGVPLGEQTH